LLDEAKAFRFVEPFYCASSSRHNFFLKYSKVIFDLKSDRLGWKWFYYLWSTGRKLQTGLRNGVHKYRSNFLAAIEYIEISGRVYPLLPVIH
jgi:hypothetical protein